MKERKNFYLISDQWLQYNSGFLANYRNTKHEHKICLFLFFIGCYRNIPPIVLKRLTIFQYIESFKSIISSKC